MQLAVPGSMPSAVRFFFALFAMFALFASTGCGRYYEIGSAHGARGAFMMWSPPSYLGAGGRHCPDCPSGPEPTTVWASPDVGAPGASLPRSSRDSVAPGAALPAFEATAARRTFNDVDLSSCRSQGAPAGHGHARVVVMGDGTVAKVIIDAPPGLTQGAVDCVGARLGAVKLAPFGGSSVTTGVSYFVP